MTLKDKALILLFSAIVAALTAWYIASNVTPTAPATPTLDPVVEMESTIRHYEELRRKAEES